MRPDSGGRPRALLATPIPPMATGLATYAVRVLECTSPALDWIVAYPEGGDPSSLPGGVEAVSLRGLNPSRLPDIRFFALGNSPHCFDVLSLLRAVGGAAVMHETVLHHMIRHCSLQRDMWEDYLDALVFEYGPAAKSVRRRLSRKASEEEYDRLLKEYPLVGRAVHASAMLLCLNCSAAEELRTMAGGRPVLRIGHPLSPVGEVEAQDPGGGPVVGMAGSFHSGRNLDLVVGAVRRLRQKRPNAVLVLAGGGYPEGLPDWVICTGRLPEPSYQGWIRAFDVAVDARHPSCGETSGSLLEVMRAGVPCVVSDSGGFRCIPSGCVRRLPAAGMAHTLPGALEDLLERPEAARKTGEAGREWAESEGSRRRCLSDWERAVSLYPPSKRRLPPRPSLAAAWHAPPEGAQRVTDGQVVAWVVPDGMVLEGPEWAEAAWVSGSGPGTAEGVQLPDAHGVTRVPGRRLLFRGGARITAVTWLGGGSG